MGVGVTSIVYKNISYAKNEKFLEKNAIIKKKMYIKLVTHQKFLKILLPFYFFQFIIG